MKMFYNKGKYGLVMMVILALVVQIVGPMVSDYVYANEEDKIEPIEFDDGVDQGSEDISGDENMPDDLSKEVKAEEPQKAGEGEEPLNETKPVEHVGDEQEVDVSTFPVGTKVSPTTLAEGAKDLGNIFTFKSLIVNKKEASENMLVTIADGTEVTLNYTWDTLGKNVNPGDWSEIEVPDAFKLGKDFEGRDILLSDGTVVGTYSIIKNKLRFEFSTTDASNVENGTLGFGVKFNEEKFTTDVVEKIDFNDKGDKTITIIGKPNGEVKSIAKSGKPDTQKDAKKITWVVDITNPSNTEITNAKLKDILPEGLEIDPNSVKVTNLTIGLNGNLNEVSEVTVTPAPVTRQVDGQNLEIDFPIIAPYKGYRVEYTTTIKDYSKTEFTNNANLVVNGKELPAESTVNVERSGGIEKDGIYLGNDEIEWSIDVNKSGGNINEAIVEDTLPEGVELVPNTIEIVKLTQDGDTWDESDLDKTVTEFPVNLGKLGPTNAYRIKFKTKIDYSKVNNGNYSKDNDFKNETVLKDGTVKIGDAEKTVTVGRKPILEKKGISNVGYDNKTLTWTVTVNEANHKIDEAVVTDILPKGLSISKDDIIIKDSSGTAVTQNVTITVPTNDGSSPTEIKIDLGNINEKYTIEYTTKITDFKVDKFENKAYLDGTGIGTGGTIPVVPVNPPNNSYSKGFSSIDYNEKTMTWTITANPKRETIKELTITDTFPNKGLILLPDTLGVKVGEVKKDIDTHYTLAPIDGNYKNGFIVEFIGETLPINAAVSITYKTSYDPEKGIDKNTSKDGNYINKAVFNGKTLNGNPVSQEKTANHKVKTESWNSGKKLGKLISIDKKGETVPDWVSGNERKIEWEIYTNYMKQDLRTGVTVSDELGYEGKIDIGSIKVIKYDVAGNGKTTLGEVLDKPNYEVTLGEKDKGFTLSFNSEVKERYAIVFTTSVPDISQGVYTNTATTKVGDKEYPYTGSIGFDKADKNVSKEALVSGDKVYTDDEVDWNIKINEGLSIIQKAVKVVDTISKGLVYKNDSLKVYKLKGTERVIVEDGYTLTKSTNDDEKTILEIVFDDSIDSTYEIEYTTVVTATDGTVNNKVDYSGTNLGTKSVETKELNAEQFSYVGGDPLKGKIKVVKTDQNGKTITNSNAKFALWYKLNGEDQKFQGKDFETKDGELEIGDLRLNETYYLEEIEAPAGYVKGDKLIEIKVEKAFNNKVENIYEKRIENIKIKGNIELFKKDNEGNIVPGVEFKLYEESDKEFKNAIQTELSDGNGLVKFENIEYGHYVIKETNTPEGYIQYGKNIEVEVDSKIIKLHDVINTKIRGDIKLTKTAKNGNALEGAEFTLYDKSDKTIQTITSNKDGLVEFKDVAYGEYIIKETKAPSGYYRYNKEIEVSIEENGKTIELGEIINNRIPPTPGRDSLELIKLGEDGQILEGAVFELLQNEEVKYTSKPTDNDGRVTFSNIAYGTYTVREKVAPKGYNLGVATQEITISTGGEVKRLEFINTKIKGDIKLIKVDGKGKVLSGAEFTLYNSKGELVEKVVSNKDGEVIFKDIPYGEYTIKETKAPEGYKFSEKEYKVAIKTTGATVVKDINGEDLRVENEMIPDPIDPTNPTDPIDPTDPTDPTDPIDPIDPIDPTNPTGPTDPIDPTNPTGPTDPIGPTNPTSPIDPTGPTVTGGPTTPGTPTNSTKPKDPNGEGLVQTGTDINFLIPIGFIMMLIGAAFISNEKRVKK